MSSAPDWFLRELRAIDPFLEIRGRDQNARLWRKVDGEEKLIGSIDARRYDQQMLDQIRLADMRNEDRWRQNEAARARRHREAERAKAGATPNEIMSNFGYEAALLQKPRSINTVRSGNVRSTRNEDLVKEASRHE